MNALLDAIMSRRRMILTAVVFLFGLGFAAWFQMPRQEDPTMPDYWGNVVAVLPGGDAETVERLLLEPLEEHLAEVAEVNEMVSEAMNELVIIQVELEPGIDDIEEVWDDVKEALEQAYTEFPDGATEPTLDRDLNDQESVVLAIMGDQDPLVLERAAKRLKKQLLDLGEVKEVKLIGEPEEQITIAIDDEQAIKLGLDARLIAQQLAQRNQIIPGGSVKISGMSVNLRPHTDFKTLEEIRRTPIVLQSGTALPLSEIAYVRQGPLEPLNSIMRFQGARAVGLGVIPKEGVHLTTFGEAVKARVAEVQSQYEPLQLEYLIYQPERVATRLNDLGRSLMMGILIVAGILLVFMGARLGVVVSVVLPLVAFASLAVYAVAGGTLQQMSISGLVIALGMLVDNAIVMAENIQWRIDRGTPRHEAARAAIKELAAPLASATGTTLAAFIPMLVAQGVTGDFVRSLPVVIMLTLTMSYVFAIFVTPLLSELFLRPRKQGSKPSALSRGVSGFVLRRPGLILIGVGLLVSVSIYGSAFVNQQFFPASDRNQLVVEVKMKEGSHLDATNAAAMELERLLMDHPEVISVAGFVGRSGPHFYYNVAQVPWKPHFAQILVTTTDLAAVSEVAKHISDYAHADMIGVEVIPRKLEQGPPVDNPVEVRIFGESLETLNEAADLVLAELQQIDGAVDARHNLSMGAPSLRFEIDDAAAARANLSRSDIAGILYGKTRGLSVGQYRTGEDPIPVVVRAEAGELFDVNDLSSIDVAPIGGEGAPLGQVARIEAEWRPAVINHFKRQRVVIVSSQLEEGVPFNQVQDVLTARMANLTLPETVTWEFGGQGEGSDEANSSIALAMPFGMLLLFAILLAEFNSFRRVAIILATVPLAATGVIPGLLLSGEPFGFMSLLGVIALVGVVVNNAIVLLDVIDSLREEGVELTEAVREAVMRRMRPILLTTATTIAGLMPLALSDSSLWPPLAWAMISGLLASTLLTLLVAPALYLLLFRKWGGTKPSPAVAAVGAVLIIGLLLNPQPAMAQTTMTLDEVMTQAAERPTALAAAERARAAEARALAARRVGRLPSVGVQGNLTYNNDLAAIETPVGDFELGDEWQKTIDAQIVQPLYDPVNQKYLAPAAAANAMSQTAIFERTKEELRAAAASFFLEVVATDAQIRATDAFIESLTQRLEEMKVRVSVGRALEADQLKVQLDLDNARQDQFALKRQRRILTKRLGQAVGLDKPVEPRFNWEAAPPMTPDLDAALAQVIDIRQDLQALERGIEAAELNRKAIGAERLPRVEAVVNYSWADGDPFRDGSFITGGLQVSWRPFAGGTVKPRMAAAQAEKAALEADLTEAKRDATLAVEEAHTRFEIAEGAFRVATTSVALAEETLRVERERHANGRATTNDLLDAEASLRQQRTALDLAKIELTSAQIAFDLAAGKL